MCGDHQLTKLIATFLYDPRIPISSLAGSLGVAPFSSASPTASSSGGSWPSNVELCVVGEEKK